MITELLKEPMFRLNIVVMSSLAFLAYGFNPPSGPIEVLQLPVALLQVYFILTVVTQRGVRGFIAPLTNIQRGLIGTLLIYMVFVSATSPVPSAHILVFSWIIHILFFVALLSFFQGVDLDQAEVVWSVLGMTALIHVVVFLVAWALWPEEVARMNLPAFGHIRHLSYLLAPAAAVMAMQFITKQEKAIFPLVCFSAAVFYILYTGSRGGAAALVTGLVVVTAYLAWHEQRVQVTRFFTLLGVTGILVLVSEILPPLPWGTVFSKGVSAFDQTGAEMLTGRDRVWGFSLRSIEQNWPWGYGPAILSELPGYQGTPYYHPHNISLQFLLHWGVLGTFIVLAAALSFFYSLWTAMRNHPDQVALPATILVTMAIHSLVDGNLFYPFSIVIAILAMTMLEVIGGKQANLAEDLS